MKYREHFKGKSHRKTAKEGWDLIRRHRGAKRSGELNSVTFQIEDAVKFVMEGLLSGAKFVRIHKGAYPDGAETIVWTMADGDGNEMPGPIGTLNDGSPCPPTCPPDTDPDPDPGGGGEP